MFYNESNKRLERLGVFFGCPYSIKARAFWYNRKEAFSVNARFLHAWFCARRTGPTFRGQTCGTFLTATFFVTSSMNNVPGPTPTCGYTFLHSICRPTFAYLLCIVDRPHPLQLHSFWSPLLSGIVLFDFRDRRLLDDFGQRQMVDVELGDFDPAVRQPEVSFVVVEQVLPGLAVNVWNVMN